MIALFLLLTTAQALGAEPGADIKINAIAVEPGNVFDPSIPSESWWLFRGANALHTTTRAGVIKRELLFKEGDPFNADLMTESERNLRRLDFLRHVEISVSTLAGGPKNVAVKTRDAWTLEPQADFSRVGGKNSWKIGVVDRNFAGQGKSLSAFYHNGITQNTNAVFYRDKQFLNTHLDFSAGVDVQDNSRQYGVSLKRPFYATITPYSAGGSANVKEENLPLYSGGVEIGRFKKIHREAALSYGRSISPSVATTRQTTLTLRRAREDFEPIDASPANILPAGNDTGIIEINGGWQKIEFIKERHIQKFDRDEDYNLGPGVSLALGIGPKWLGTSSSQILPSASARAGRSWGRGHFAFIETKAGSRILKERTNNLVWSTKAQHYYQRRPNQTFAIHVAYAHGYRLDQDHLLTLGDDSGLHGYAIGQFAGDRRLLVNLENRLFFADDVFHLMSFGGVIFFDSGNAWTGDRPGGFLGLKNAVGVGLRIAPSRSTRNEPISIDFAYALNDNLKGSRLVVSITSGFHFGEPISFVGAQ